MDIDVTVMHKRFGGKFWRQIAVLQMIILKWTLKTTGSEGVDRTDMVQDRQESRAIVHIVMKLLDSQNADNTLDR